MSSCAGGKQAVQHTQAEFDRFNSGTALVGAGKHHKQRVLTDGGGHNIAVSLNCALGVLSKAHQDPEVCGCPILSDVRGAPQVMEVPGAL